MTDPPRKTPRSGRVEGSDPSGTQPPRGASDQARKPPLRGAVAGSVLIATLVLCAAIGFGLGAAVGAPVPLGIVGVFVGAIAGIVVVARRFSDI
jgi:hypothetical protein